MARVRHRLAAPAALRRAGRLAEGWIAGTRHDVTRIAESVEQVRAGAREAGRDPDAVRIVVRAAVDLTDSAVDVARAPFHGSREQVLGDFVALRAQGVTEVFVDLNFSPRVVSPHVDAGEAVAYAEHVLDAFAPASPAS